MPGTYTKNVVLTGDSNTAGPDYTLVNVNNVTWASGTISSDATSCSFTVSDWTNPANLNDIRSAEFQIRHWLYNEANPLEEHYDSFTITQYANNGAVVTTTTQAPTTSTTTIAIESPPPTTTTQAPTTSTTTIALETTQAPTIAAAGFLEDANTDEPISEYSTSVGEGFNLYMHSNVAWRLEFSNSNLSIDGDTSGPPYTDVYDHELGPFDAITSGTTLINLVNDADGTILDTVTVTIGAATIDPAIELDLEDLTIPSGNRVDDINFTIQPGVESTFTPISAEASPTSPGSIVFFRDVFGLGEFTQVNQPAWIVFVEVNHSNGIGTLTISTTNPDAQILGGYRIRITHPYDGTIFDEVNITKLRIREVITTTTTTSPSTGPTGPSGCHLAGTKILMSDGTTKLIEELVAGDIVTSYGFNGLSQEEEAWTAWSTIENDFIATSATSEIKSIGIKQYKSYRKINTSIKNDHIRITYEHPVLVNRSGEIRYMSVKHLELGDKLYYRDESGVIDWIDFVSMETMHTETAFTTYTLDVEVEDSYLANGLVAHNIIDDNIDNRDDTVFIENPDDKGFQEEVD